VGLGGGGAAGRWFRHGLLQVLEVHGWEVVGTVVMGLDCSGL
jgi:hypothetical protein